MLLLTDTFGIPYIYYERFFSRRFRYFSKILDCILFLIFVSKYIMNPNVFILGAPCVRNRFVSLLLNKKYIIYLRCLHSNGEKLTYLSDKVDAFFKKFGINNRLTNPYMARCHLVTSKQTEKFLKFRKAGNNIIDIGAIWLKNRILKKKSQSEFQKRKVYFISQAFAEHDFLDAQFEQENFVKNLSSFLLKENLELIIKKHPRDYHAYNGFTLFNGNADKFLESISQDDIVVSFFSTLGFEISLLGGDVKFVSLPSLKEVYNPLYIQNNVKFYEGFDLDFSFLFDEKVTYSVFSQVECIDINRIIY
ncbi:MAG: polysialyltransferase family glycosyltransferase [[Pasteurella] aerogenes]|nr:polysialyltransferase family glycosyltransferase [[Pasteurella] aerogenes]